MPEEASNILERLTHRYGNVDAIALETVLRPIIIPIRSIDSAVYRVPGQTHYRASFTIRITNENAELMTPGQTGKFVPGGHVTGTSTWQEIAKGRVSIVDHSTALAYGEIYGGNATQLTTALAVLSTADYLEIDQYGASAKVLSALTEFYLSKAVKSQGYSVRRMPEDVARHIGPYYYYDFEFGKAGTTKRIEVKSLWGTNTKCARLIHSLGAGYPTSSCKFDTQDIFAVSMFLRSGNLEDFAFARSIPIDLAAYGLPRVPKYPEHVTQNPVVAIGDGIWFDNIDDVWLLP